MHKVWIYLEKTGKALKSEGAKIGKNDGKNEKNEKNEEKNGRNEKNINVNWELSLIMFVRWN